MKSRPIILWLGRVWLGAFTIIWIATVVLWCYSVSHSVRISYWFQRSGASASYQRQLQATVANGSIVLECGSFDYQPDSGWPKWERMTDGSHLAAYSEAISPAWIDTSVATCGFDYTTTNSVTMEARQKIHTFRLPLVLPAVLATPVAVVLLLRHLRVRRADRVGLCQTCGYDLRSSHDRCPECGTPIAKARSVLSSTGIPAG